MSFKDQQSNKKHLVKNDELLIDDSNYFERINFIGLKLFMITKKDFKDLVKYFHNGPGIDKVKDLSHQFKDISLQFNDLFRNEPPICDIHYRFSFLYFVIHKEYLTETNSEYLNESKYYFDLAAKMTRRTNTKPSPINKKLKRFGNISCDENDNIFLEDRNLSSKPKIDYLRTMLRLEDQNNLNKIILLYYLGMTYQSLGCPYWLKYILGFENKEHSDLALLNFRKSIRYFNLQLKYEREENNSSNEIQKREIIKAKINVTYSYQLVSYLREKLKFLKECSICYDKILKLSLDEKQVIDAIHSKISIDSIVHEITEISNQILNSSSDNNQLECDNQNTINKINSQIKLNITNGMYSFKTTDQLDKALISLTEERRSQFIDSYISFYFEKKFDIHIIEENSVKKWIYQGDVSWAKTMVKLNQNLKSLPRN